jgi:dipeptidyl aminopeptidase/acylaminoacyl peptidase
LHWGAGDRLVFLAELDGWPHLYSVPAAGGTPTLLTPGEFMVEYVRMTPDRAAVIYNANTGGDKDDIERRHLFTVPVDRAAPAPLTRGYGIEWEPAVSGDGAMVAFIGSDSRQPPLPFVRPLTGGAPRALTAELIAADFPALQLVEPDHVTFKSTDGLLVHAQLFKRPGGAAKSPAVVFVHGGPPRQMLLGWHYRFYYANSYAVNQYLASRGFIVLSVNYRLGIGYGHDFQVPEQAGTRGASEYQDVLAGGQYLRSRPDVDPARVGIWGGSYGGCRSPGSGRRRRRHHARRPRRDDEGRLGIVAGGVGEVVEVTGAAHPRR